MSDRFIGNAPQSPWYDICVHAFMTKKRVSVLVDGTYKPYTGKVIELNGNMLTLRNEYSTEFINLTNIKAVRVYD